MTAFIAEAGRRGIRVLLDLVAGHTSVKHPWFQASAGDSGDDRYIWSDRAGPGFVPSPGRRPGYYLKNFFDEQPALNFGYARAAEAEPWRQPPGAPGPQANRDALCQIMAYWLDRGVAGFRVDMAYSLVKDDPDFAATAALWAELRAWVQARYPDAVLLPENDYRVTPGLGVRAGFDADFFLVIEEAHGLLFNNGGAGTLPTRPEHRGCYFDASAPDPDTTLGGFLRLWEEHQAGSGGRRLVVLPTADHDFSRLATAPRTAAELGAAFAFLLTWGSIPSIYYGDEIGLRYLTGLPDHEGSRWSPGFNRAGCRTPMQWDASLPNAGFSTAPAERLYLSSTCAATVTWSSSTRQEPPAPRTSRRWPCAAPGRSKRAGPPSRADASKQGLSDTAFLPSNRRAAPDPARGRGGQLWCGMPLSACSAWPTTSSSSRRRCAPRSR